MGTLSGKEVRITIESLGVGGLKSGYQSLVEGPWELVWTPRSNADLLTIQLDAAIGDTGIKLVSAEVGPVSAKVMLKLPILWEGYKTLEHYDLQLVGVRLKDGTVLTNIFGPPTQEGYTWLAAWDTIPPVRPFSLKAFFGTLTRRISIDRLRERMAEKRGKGEALIAIDELSECIPSSWSMEKTIEDRELVRAFNDFLANRPETERNLFVARYWYGLSIADISVKFGVKRNTVVSKLRRNRIRLLRYLEKEGLQ